MEQKSFCYYRASEFRKKGNDKFKSGQYYKALLHYNQSLMTAKQIDCNESLSLAFGNRSAVYFEVKEYEMCIENIRLAKQHEYPADKMGKLIEREEKCIKIMCDQMSHDPENDQNFFKLSYPANKKIPFIVNCLEMHKDRKYGRGIYTTQDLKIGDVLCLEKVFLLDISSEDRRCRNCASGNLLNLIPSADQCKFKFILIFRLSRNTFFFRYVLL